MMKSRVEQGAELIRARVASRWDEAAVAAVVAGVEPRRRRRRRTLAAGCGLALAASVVIGGAVRDNDRRDGTIAAARAPATVAPGPRIEPLPAPRAAGEGTFRDGSRVVPIASGTVFHTIADTPARVEVRLDRGGARFEVTPSATRTFTVSAGGLRVVVVGTVFSVERTGAALEVAVERGKVRVEARSGEARLLVAGERASFDEPPAETAAAPPSALPPRVPASPPPTVGDLMAEADAARAGGRPEEAVRLLERLVRDHPRQFRAPLAAFTAGRLYLEQLGRPRLAAERFAQVRALAPSSSLAEDALAREVEAWAAAGEPARGRARAEEYLRRYPAGLRASNVRRLAGLGDL
jgi:transmembrane sensor